MIYRESLGHLVEIQSLKKQESHFQEAIESEHERISALEKRQSFAQNEIERLTKEIADLKIKAKELELDSLLSEQQKLKAKEALVTNEKEALALEKTLKENIEKAQNLEAEIFTALELEEKYSDEIKDLRSFLNGLQSTIKEISEEVKTSTTEQLQDLKSVQSRIQSLLGLCHKDILVLFERAQKKHPKSPLSYINGSSCKECRMVLNSVLKSQVENISAIEICPYCERILLPTTLNY